MAKKDENYKFVILKKRELKEDEDYSRRKFQMMGLEQGMEWENPFEMELTADEVIEAMKFLMHLKNTRK